MAQTVITSAFERYKAQEAAGGRRIVLDQFIFANIPGLDPSASPGRDDPVPDDSLIVWRQNADASGMVSEDVVTYAVTLPESAGDFTFNWMGLLNSESGTLCHITTLETQHKTRTADGRQGNVLTYSVNLKFSGASEQTGITTPVSTWQIDFSARLHGMDEAARLAMLDLYGSALFFDDAFRMTLTAPGSATLSPGTAWLRGLRVVLGHPATLTFPAGQEQVISLDCTLTGSLTGENQAVFTLVSAPLQDYTDALGFAHYVEPVARIAADGTLTDLRRTRKPISQQLDGEFLTVEGNLSEIATRGQQAQRMLRSNIGLGNSATLDVGAVAGTVAAGNDARITGAMQKESCGGDIPDKTRFVRNIGLEETVRQAAHIITANGDVTGSVWGGLLSNWLTGQFSARDKNINARPTTDQVSGWLKSRDDAISARATTAWVNQNFANKSTACLAVNGWFRDASTGFMIQWGTHPGGSATYTVNLPQPFPNACLWALGWVAGALSYGNDDWSNSAGLLNNSQIRVTTDHNWSTAWIAIGY